MDFIKLTWIDALDIFCVAYLLYQIYSLIRGTVAVSIFIGIFSMYLFWQVVKALEMQLLSSMLGQFMGVGVVALIVVFQQEIRGVFLLLGSKYFSSRTLSFSGVFSMFKDKVPRIKMISILTACENMSRTKTGALMVIAKNSEMFFYAQTGDIVNANTSSRLLETIFFKNTPLHDGAVIIRADKIYAVRCVLPVSDNPNLPKQIGLRHRAAVGISERTDALVVIVSEETGGISYAKNGKLTVHITLDILKRVLEEEFAPFEPKKSKVVVS